MPPSTATRFAPAVVPGARGPYLDVVAPRSRRRSSRPAGGDSAAPALKTRRGPPPLGSRSSTRRCRPVRRPARMSRQRAAPTRRSLASLRPAGDTDDTVPSATARPRQPVDDERQSERVTSAIRGALASPTQQRPRPGFVSGPEVERGRTPISRRVGPRGASRWKAGANKNANPTSGDAAADSAVVHRTPRPSTSAAPERDVTARLRAWPPVPGRGDDEGRVVEMLNVPDPSPVRRRRSSLPGPHPTPAHAWRRSRPAHRPSPAHRSATRRLTSWAGVASPSSPSPSRVRLVEGERPALDDGARAADLRSSSASGASRPAPRWRTSQSSSSRDASPSRRGGGSSRGGAAWGVSTLSGELDALERGRRGGCP